MDIAKNVYSITESFPTEEKFGIISQIRRCGVSIPSNIAEGAARNSKKEFVNFLYISLGSLSELDTQLELSKRLGFIKEDIWKNLDDQIVKADKVLSGLIRSQKKFIK